jgi:hypothetical protein
MTHQVFFHIVDFWTPEKCCQDSDRFDQVVLIIADQVMNVECVCLNQDLQLASYQ